ncbi:hypothetical protein HDU97_002920 [Phlyctochytrium planicorne]|nr:hypothetical protein HDU97_002920 [Phlyctochytrium planicorne]
MQRNQRFVDFLSRTQGENYTTNAEESNFTRWDKSIPWAPSTFNMRSEPKVFACSGQLVADSTSFLTSCFVDATRCRSGTVQKANLLFEAELFLGPKVINGPKLATLQHILPPTPSLALNSFSSILQQARGVEIDEFFHLQGFSGDPRSFNVAKRPYSPTPPLRVNPLIAWDLDSRATNLTDSQIQRFITNYTDTPENVTSYLFSNIDVQYGVRTVTRLGLPFLPSVELKDVEEPILIPAPYTLTDSVGWNWTIHSSTCHREILLCDSLVESGIVTKSWNCLPVPVFCDNPEVLCEDGMGIGQLWETEEALVYAMNSVQMHLMGNLTDNDKSDYDGWNATWTDETESDAVIYSRKVFEKSFGLLHFAWAMSTLPLSFNASAEDKLITLRGVRQLESLNNAVALDLILFVVFASSLGMTIIGGIGLVIEARGRPKKKHETRTVAGSPADRRKFITLSGQIGYANAVPAGLGVGYDLLSLASQNISSHAFMTTGLLNATNATTQANQRFLSFLSRNQGENYTAYAGESTQNEWDKSIPWAPSNFNMRSEPKIFVCSGQLVAGSTSFQTSCFVDATRCRSGTVQKPKTLIVSPHPGVIITPKLETIRQWTPNSTPPLLYSFSSILEKIRGGNGIQMPNLGRIWGSVESDIAFKAWRGIDLQDPSTKENYLDTWTLDNIFSKNASDIEVNDFIRNYAERSENVTAYPYSQIAVEYGVRTVSNLDLPPLPVAILRQKGEPVLAASPFILTDSMGWNWTIHSSICNHEILLCDSLVESGLVTKSWNCLPVPILCDDPDVLCEYGMGVGELWETEEALVYAMNSVQAHLMGKLTETDKSDYDGWNTTWTNETESDAVIYSRKVFEKSFGLLHFAWAMSTLPLSLNTSAGDELITLHGFRKLEVSSTAVAIDLILLSTLLGCLGITVLVCVSLSMRWEFWDTIEAPVPSVVSASWPVGVTSVWILIPTSFASAGLISLMMTVTSMVSLTFAFLFLERYWTPKYDAKTLVEMEKWLYCSSGMAYGNVVGSIVFGFYYALIGKMNYFRGRFLKCALLPLSVWGILSLISGLANLSIHTVTTSQASYDSPSLKGLNMSAVAGSSADKRRFLWLPNDFGNPGAVPSHIDLGYKLLSLASQNLSSYSFVALGTINITNATMNTNERFQSFIKRNQNKSFLADFNDTTIQRDWNEAFPSAPSNFDTVAEPKAFVCSGQLATGSASLVTSCFVDTSRCRSGTVHKTVAGRTFPMYIPKGGEMQFHMYMSPKAPQPILSSFSPVLEAARGAIRSALAEETKWSFANSMRILSKQVALEPAQRENPLTTWILDRMLMQNISDEKILDLIQNYIETPQEVNALSITNLDVHYGINTVSNLGFDGLPVKIINPDYSPVLAASPYIITDSAGWNWTIHSSVCHHEILLCDALIESGKVIASWNCLPTPIFCDNTDNPWLCDDNMGLGDLWEREDALVHAINSVRANLMGNVTHTDKTDYKGWNATWLNETEADAVIDARKVLEKAFGLLHFAWAMSSMPLTFNVSAGDELVTLHGVRRVEALSSAVAIDLVLLLALVGCLGVTLLGWIILLLMARGRDTSPRKHSWDPIDHCRVVLSEAR